MKILVYADKFVDFAVPVYMKDKRFEEFIDLMNTIFPGNIEIKKISEPDRFKQVREYKKTKKWSAEDYLVLLEISDNGVAAQKLGRSEMAVQMKRGEFVPSFNKWAQAHGRTPDKQAVQEYLEKNNG